jgi:hypothetical protein
LQSAGAKVNGTRAPHIKTPLSYARGSSSLELEILLQKHRGVQNIYSDKRYVILNGILRYNMRILIQKEQCGITALRGEVPVCILIFSRKGWSFGNTDNFMATTLPLVVYTEQCIHNLLSLRNLTGIST